MEQRNKQMEVCKLVVKLLTILILLLSQISYAQTRFYFAASGFNSVSDVTPTISGGGAWTASAGSVVRLARTSMGGTTGANTSLTVDNSSSTASTLFVRYVSEPLAAQTISGNVRGQIRMNLSSATGCTAIPKIVVTVVDILGNIRATLFNGTSGATAITSTMTNRFSPASAALTSFACNTGDRIVFEIGIVRTAGTTSRTGNIAFGYTSGGTDLPVDQTTTAGNNPWIEISNAVTFNRGLQITKR